jgi:hypothetical protein
MKTHFSLAIVALFATASLVGMTDAASARGFQRHVTAQGAYGRGYHKDVDRHCSGGACSGHRSVQSNRGYGWTSDHDRSCANGSCNASSTVRANNGNVWTRSRGVTNNGDGSASWYSNASGPNGSVSRNGTVTRPQD